ncbi:hypothetical protein E4T49_04456 [Aureobasidium sp. EXF-10728]|nr:hypothetical protein E4T49_04456 [Aureobasidium sp. EXF-10728]
MTFSRTIKTESKSSILSIPLYLVAQPYQHIVRSSMADPSSSPPVRAKPEPTDSLSPSTSVELHRRSKTGCMFIASIIPELPHIISAIDDPLDSQLLSYFITHAGQALNIYSETHNPFDGFVIDMALANTGLMHSLLCLSASCLLIHQPTLAQEIVVRHSHHFDQAVVTLRKGVEAYSSDNSTQSADCIVLQTIMLAQEAIITGEVHGSYRCHLSAASRLVNSCVDLSADVQSLARQFLLYHNLANTVSCLDPVNHVMSSPVQADKGETGEQNTLPEGCVDALLHSLLDPMSRTRQVRDGIRYHRSTNNTRWFKDEQLLSLALGVETQLRTWQSRFTPNTPQYWTSLAYRQSAYVYLYRTIKPSMPSPELAQSLSDGLSYTSLALRDIARNNNSMISWICGVLLVPLFLLGCAAFDPVHRQAVVENLDDLHACNSRTSIFHARAILEEVWSRMDAAVHGADDDAWDWESVMKDLGVDIMLS